MQTFAVRLESTTTSQWRRRTLDAESADQAVQVARDLEDWRVAYDLRQLGPIRGITIREHEQGVDAHVNAHVFRDSGLSGQDLLDFCRRDHGVDGDGKAHGPNNVIRAHLAAHNQREPYEVVSVEPVMPSVDQIISALRTLQGDEKAWKTALKRMRDDGVWQAVVTGSLFGLTAQAMIDGSTPIVWSSATIKHALTTSAYTPNQDTHHFFSDVTNEVTGTAYVAGGATLGTKTSAYDTATDQIRLGSAATSWASSTITARRSVIWNDTAGASTTDPVMGWLDFGADVSTTNGTFQITPDPTGWIVYDVT